MMNDNVASIEELDALARERLATHHALEMATLSFAPEATTRDIATRLHRFCLDDDEESRLQGRLWDNSKLPHAES